MNLLKKITLSLMIGFSFMLTGCLNIEEEVTVKANGSGQYAMRMDMSQMKSMLDMMKGMGEETKTEEPATDGVVQDVEPPADETAAAEEAAATDPGGDLTKMGEEFVKSVEVLKLVKGIKNAQAINDTTNLLFGYTFDFDNVESLNKAIVAMNKDKFEGQKGDAFKMDKKSFERTSAFDMGQLISQAMNDSEEGAESMDMIKMFFGEMSYKQVYHFDRKVKKSANAGAQISADGKTVILDAKPFGDNANMKSVTNVIKLK